MESRGVAQDEASAGTFDRGSKGSRELTLRRDNTLSMDLVVQL